MTNLYVILSAAILTLSSLAQPLMAAEIIVSIQDQQGKPLTNIVALLRNKNKSPPPLTQSRRAIIDQINREFVPHTLVVQQGTLVSFPNSDNIQHHVYSFSPAQTFELKLYSELEVEPQLFDTPGVVELGCNVHDWMLGYIYVADTPYFAQSNRDGQAIITVPDGDYSLSLWHPRLTDNELSRLSNVTVANQTLNINRTLLEPLLPSLVEYDAVEGFNSYD